MPCKIAFVDKLRHSANVFKLTSFVVGQRHNNSIANATDEFKRVLFLAGDFVDVMPERGDYVDRVVVASPVHRHVFIVVLFTEHALDCLFVKSIRTHSGRALNLMTFFVGQFDDDRRILVVQCGTKLSNNCLLSMFILTVEDEFLISEYLRAILEGGGHKVIATFDAGEAIEVLERVRDIQLVITDIDMPGSMDGLRLAAAIRDRWPPIHLIVVTGFAPPNSYELPRDSLFIPKPYGAAEILSAVRHFQ
jgi:CheY-like chemotaxis protein